MENAAALEIEYDVNMGNGASATQDKRLMTAPRERINDGRNAWVRAYEPCRCTARWRSSTAGSNGWSGTMIPALLMRRSSGPAASAAARTWAGSVTSSGSGVTRGSG